MNDRTFALTTNNAAMVLYGLTAILIGPTLPGIIADYELSLASGGLVSAMQNAGGIIGSFAAALIADRLRRPLGVVISFVLLGSVWFMIGSASELLWVIGWFAVSGALIRVLDVFLNAHTGAIAGSASGRPMNVLHMFFSIGALLGPIAARGIMGTGVSWRGVYLASAGLYVGVVLLASIRLRRYVQFEPMPTIAVPDHAAGQSEPRTGQPAQRGHTRRAVALLAAALFFYAIHQIGVSTWTPFFMENVREAAPAIASAALSVYWVGIMVGRFIASRAVERRGPRLLLIAGSFGSAAASAVVAAAVPVPVVIAALLVAGMLSGATIPLAYSLGYRLTRSRLGALTAVLSLVMLAGRFLGPWVIGIIADAYGMRLAMLLPALALLAVGALIAPVRR